MPTPPRNTNSDQDNISKDERDAGTLVGYVDEESGAITAVQGDADAPYAIAHGRASSDGTLGLVSEGDGAAQRLATTPLGHLWTDMFLGAAPVSGTNPLPTTPAPGAVGAAVPGSLPTTTQGDIAHDAVDAGNPVKIGGIATNVPSGSGAAVAVGDRVNQAMTVKGRSIGIPAAMAGVKTQIVAAATALAAANAWVSSGVISLDSGAWRRLRLLLDLDAGAAGSVCGLMVLGCCTEVAPVAGDDDWFMLGTSDGTWASAAILGALPAGSDFTATPNLYTTTVRGSVMLSPAASAAADEIRMMFPALDITGIRHFQVLYSQQDAGAQATIGLWYSLSV
jgi:hypothetical protein